ncbi:MAG: MATE family efflux transporter [Firmicutes bacterium]|nr:MATE family efflux transporter [Bacillota bacterium]
MTEKEGRNKLKQERNGYLFDNRYLFWLLAPLLIEQLFAFAVGVTDSVMVASVGESAVSAVSLVDSIMMLILALMAALSTGGAVVVGQYLGQKRLTQVRKTADQLILAVLAIALIITGLLYALKNLLLPLIFGDIDDDVMDYCNTYYLITVASIPFIAIYNAGSALFRSSGNSRISMVVCFFMNVINIPGNYILLHVFHMGVSGVAFPTLAARVFSAVAVFVLLRNPHLRVHLGRGPLVRPNFRLIRQILTIGIPNAVENSMFQLGKLILLSLISSLGTVSIAANAVGNTIAGLAILPGMAIGMGAVSVISQCVGAGDYAQVRYYTKKLVLWAYVAMGVTNALGILLLPWIMEVYGLTDATSALATKVLLLNFICSIAIWPLSFTFPNVLRAAGDVMYTMIVGVGSMWMFRIMAAYLLAVHLKLGLMGVWMAMILDWIVRSVCFLIRYNKGRWIHRSIDG